MNIRQAILAAADHIEQHPESFEIVNPYMQGNKGCALVWIGHYAGFPKMGARTVCDDLLGGLRDSLNAKPDENDQFFGRLYNLGLDRFEYDNPKEMANALRLYADKWHPSEKEEKDNTPKVELCTWAQTPFQPAKVAA